MVALGTTFSAFWIMVNNSWMQVPVGYVAENGVFAPVDWTKIIFNSVVWSRFPHMVLAAYLTGAFCVAATGAWYVLRGEFSAEARIMLRILGNDAKVRDLTEPWLAHCDARFNHQSTLLH